MINVTRHRKPRLRTVEKVKPPYPLNQFPSDFGYKLGREIVYLLATKSRPDVAGSEWKQIFATCIGAAWKPSNVGLDDVCGVLPVHGTAGVLGAILAVTEIPPCPPFKMKSTAVASSPL